MAYPSTYLDIQNGVAAKARMDTTDSAQLALIKGWINRVYTDVCVSTEAIQESDTLTLTSNVASYTMPAGVLRIKQMVVKQPNQSNYNIPLTLVPLMQILQWRQSSGGQPTTNGTAMYYSLTGQDDLDLYPTPAAADTLLLYYISTPVALSGNTDVPVIPEPYATECLENGALIHATDYLKDLMSNNTYRQNFEIWRTLFRQHLRKREGAQTKQLARAAAGWRPPSDPSVDLGGS